MQQRGSNAFSFQRGYLKVPLVITTGNELRKLLMEKEEPEKKNTLLDIAEQRERKVNLTEIAKWLEFEIKEVNNDLGNSLKMRFGKMKIKAQARHKCLMDMAQYFLRKDA